MNKPLATIQQFTINSRNLAKIPAGKLVYAEFLALDNLLLPKTLAPVVG
jgi:hypothetical protein